MLYILTVCLGIIIGLIMKGRISNLAEIKIKKVWLIILAFLIQAVARIIGAKGIQMPAESAIVIQLAVFLLMAACFWFNRYYSGMVFIGIGYLMNTVVMAANGGRMPVSEKVLAATSISHFIDNIKTGKDIKHVIMNSGTKMKFLADIIPIPGFLGSMMQVVSIGDLVILVGIFILTVELVTGRKIFGTNDRKQDFGADDIK
ncbi:MAG TPA: DUF5317 domain-containing protein [Clostridiaceae bacterium]|nr:DUF5317 domain-containing protein [Clostridiaceae bacterium]